VEITGGAPVLEGLTFQGAREVGREPGLLLTGTSAVVRGCVVQDHRRWYRSTFGGGIDASNDSTLIEACVVRRNQAEMGGGIYARRRWSETRIRGCIIADNIATTYGGGIDGGAIVEDNLIVGNFADSHFDRRGASSPYGPALSGAHETLYGTTAGAGVYGAGIVRRNVVTRNHSSGIGDSQEVYENVVTFNRRGAGIAPVGPTRGNVVADNEGDGISHYCSSQDSITGNTSFRSTGSGIRIAFPYELDLRNNIVAENLRYGVEFAWWPEPVVLYATPHQAAALPGEGVEIQVLLGAIDQVHRALELRWEVGDPEGVPDLGGRRYLVLPPVGRVERQIAHHVPFDAVIGIHQASVEAVAPEAG